MGKLNRDHQSNSYNTVQQGHTIFEGEDTKELLSHHSASSSSRTTHASSNYQQQQHHGGLHKKIKQSKIAKHTSDYLQRKLANLTLKHVKNSSPSEEMPPIIVHFHHNNSNNSRTSRDSDSVMSNSSAATTLTWRATLGPEDNELVSSLSSKQIQYQELLHEFVMTEETYLSDLQLVTQVFVTDLQPSWNNLPEPIQRTFESLHVIIEFHTAVVANLRECQSAQPPLIVGDVVERFRNYEIYKIPHIFNVYKEYFANFESANDLIAKSLSNPQNASLKALGQYVQERCLYPECRSLTLQSFLLKPVQRLMKYPLFLKSQIGCFEENDGAIHQHVQCMSEMDAAIRSIEEYKIQAEQSLRLSDLGERIRNLKEIGIQLNQPHRRLVHEGPLILVPSLSSSSSSSSSPTSSSSGKAAAYLAPQRSFSESSKQLFSKQKKQHVYVFLFNDLILFTKIRTKRISQAESELRTNMSGGRKLYGPAPDALFKLATVPGQITHLDRIVLQQESASSNGTNNRSAWFGSFCRNGTSTTATSRSNGSSMLSRSYHQNLPQQQNPEQNVNPLQFTCSIASRNIVSMLLEAKTTEEKQLWCNSIDSVRDEHCQRSGTGNSTEDDSTSSKQYSGFDKRSDKPQRSLAAESKNTTVDAANSNGQATEVFNTSWFSENRLRSLMAGQLFGNDDDDDDDDEDSDEFSSVYSSLFEEGGLDKSLQSSIFSTEAFSISSQPQPKIDC
ncbi:Dbl homology domain-containing protein [Zychaea mexicana]|uniref:rho guanine nucleotide exchange factor n=1 Tax=Zychaea mexicana TaxID=64656 RepID=UPI0022FEA602|nr:rho guanine nucleotide exchange factor [Zychaea mexicana]KAI9490777.1 Dbl homology domain-containing protein [Zychaea mexicana]